MITRKDMTKAIWKMAHAVAREMDFSQADAQVLHTALKLSFEHLEHIRTEIFDWAAKVVDQPPVRENPDLVKRCIDIAWKAVPVAVFFLAITIAAAREVESRSKKSKINYYFALLRLGQLLGLIELQTKAWRHLKRILSSIPWKMGWFHPERNDGWIGVIELAIDELLKRHASVDAPSILQKMTENRFAGVYPWVKARFIDEIRRLKREHEENSAWRILAPVPAPKLGPDEGPQRLRVIRLVEDFCRQNDRKEGPKEILRQVGQLLKRPEQVAGMTEKEIRAQMVNAIAQNRGVSRQQARRDLRDFDDLVRVDETLQRLVGEIRELVPNEARFRIVLRPLKPSGQEGTTNEGAESREEG